MPLERFSRNAVEHKARRLGRGKEYVQDVLSLASQVHGDAVWVTSEAVARIREKWEPTHPTTPLFKRSTKVGPGTALRRRLGCGCESIPFRKWDAKGVAWCREHREQIAMSIAMAPKARCSIRSALLFVDDAIAEAASKKIALVMPPHDAWTGPARGQLFTQILESAGYDVTPIPLGGNGTLDADDLSGFDVVFNHCMQAGPLVIEQAANANPQTQFVNMNHSAIGHLERLGERYMTRFLESLRLAKERHNCWYASQDSVAESVGAAAGIERCIWLPTPCHSIEPREYRPPGEPATVVIAGRHDSIKNNLVQLLACGLAKDRVRLVLCMDRQARTERLVDQIGIEHEWRGRMPHAEWLEFLRGEPDVVLACSHAESFGYVACEAMQSGVPVVASDAIRFADPELRATTGSPEDIADRIRLAISDHERLAAKALEIGRATAENQGREYLARVKRLLI